MLLRNVLIQAITLLFLTLTFDCHVFAQVTDNDPSLKMRLDFNRDFSGGKVVDVSGNGNDGWQFNPTNWILPTSGVFGGIAGLWHTNFVMCDCTPNGQTYPGMPTNGCHFYAAGQYVGVTNLNGIRYLTNATISLWAQFDTNNQFAIQLLHAGFSAIYAQGGIAAASNSWTLGRIFTPYLCFAVFPPDGSTRIVVHWPDDVVQSGGYVPNLATLNMHLYTVTIDCPANRAVAYYDGVPYMSGTIDLPWVQVYHFPVPWICVGASGEDGSPQWGDDRFPNDGYHQGRLDDVRIYNRTLSATEVHALYQGSTYAQNLALHSDGPSSVKLSWSTQTNATYQVEYESALLPASWAALGLPSPGTGLSNSISDSTIGQGSRFYRVRVLP